MTNSGKSQGRIFWGLLLIVIGALFLFDQMGRLDFGYLISRYWPVIFIVIGISILISNNFRNAGAGIFFIIFGAFFLLMRMRIFDRNLWHYFWPLLVIGIGLWILIKPIRSSIKSKSEDPELVADELNISTVFSGIKRRIEAPNFKGGKAEVIFGSAEIDMTDAGLEGGKATLFLSAVFGSIELRVPKEWEVVVDGSPILGSIEDKKRSVVKEAKTGTLQVKASATFGSIEIKD